MKIVPFEKKYLDEMAKLFAEDYSEPEHERMWDIKTAREYLIHNLEHNPEYCRAAINENDECVGAIFCRVNPYYSGQMLFIDNLHVKPGFRKQGVASLLLQNVCRQAKQSGLLGVLFLQIVERDFLNNGMNH